MIAGIEKAKKKGMSFEVSSSECDSCSSSSSSSSSESEDEEIRDKRRTSPKIVERSLDTPPRNLDDNRNSEEEEEEPEDDENTDELEENKDTGDVENNNDDVAEEENAVVNDNGNKEQDTEHVDDTAQVPSLKDLVQSDQPSKTVGTPTDKKETTTAAEVSKPRRRRQKAQDAALGTVKGQSCNLNVNSNAMAKDPRKKRGTQDKHKEHGQGISMN